MVALTNTLKKSVFTVNQLFTATYLLLCALITVVLIQTGPAVYDAGTGDHLVLSPAGLLRAKPSLYQNDYFVRNAKMPHWAFEIFTDIGSRLGVLGPTYFTYWIVGIVFCAYGHLIIARHVSHRLSYALAVMMLTTQLVGTRVMFGTSAVILNQALPHALAASMGFVVIASMLSNKRRVTFVFLPILPLIHIQIGTIVVGIVLVLSIIERITGRVIQRKYLVSSLLAISSICFGLLYRPIAGNIQDFSRLCRDLAPHHCYASSWSSSIMVGCFLILAIATVGFLFVDKSIFTLWQRFCIYVLPSLALGLTLWLDRNDLGWFANFVRGNNVYRVAVVLLPWVYWVPVLVACSAGRKAWRFCGVLISLFLLFKLMSLSSHGNYFESRPKFLFILVIVIALTLIADRSQRLQRQEIIFLLSFCIVSVPLLVGFNYGQYHFVRPNLTFQPDRNLIDFGTALSQDVTQGQIVVGDPTLSWIRMASGIAYGVDCKFRPIGGGPPLYEYYNRINPLGGYDQACNFGSFSTVSVDDLVKYYEASSADLLLISPDDARVNELTASGWKIEPSVHMRPFGLVLVTKPS